MEYKFLNKSISIESMSLPKSDRINSFLLKNYESELLKALNFIKSDGKFLYVHGFMGTGKRQFINYICDFASSDVVKLEYYCKEATVCDDILLSFSEVIENLSVMDTIEINSKITTLNKKLRQQISKINKPIIIVIHSLDDVLEENLDLIKDFFAEVIQDEENVKLIISTKAMLTDVLEGVEVDTKIFLKALNQDIYKEFLKSNNINATDTVINDFYKYTRGYYYYIALTIKIIQAMKVDLSAFLQKFNQSGMDFDSYLGFTYINLIPASIRNFFWFLRSVRHGMSIAVLEELELFDEFSINYLKTNLMIFEDAEILYVQDYFLQKIDISIPEKTQNKLHKYIIDVYEEQLKKPVKERSLLISRQAMRAEIEYHNNCLSKNQKKTEVVQEEKVVTTTQAPEVDPSLSKEQQTIVLKVEKAKKYVLDKKYTEAIETYNSILEDENVDLRTVIDVRLQLARVYKTIDENNLAEHYFELVETYYKQHKEFINLNYLYYELTDLYFKMYKNNRAVETIKKVIYSVDTPKSLLVSACTLLGNIYSDMENFEDAYSYYQKALDSLDENTDHETLINLYFKFALVNDDLGNFSEAFEYYNKCISLGNDDYHKGLAYSNLASCYMDNENYNDALTCFQKAYNIEKSLNNYEGIYYNALNIAKIHMLKKSNKALDFLLEAKQSAEFLNENFYLLESEIALGDFYYNDSTKTEDALIEYSKAKVIAEKLARDIDLNKIVQRIEDMKHRMDEKKFSEIMRKYGK